MTKQINNRPIANKIGPMLPVFYEILLLVENDECNYRKYCDWKFVKKSVKKCKILDVDGFAKIISDSGKYELSMSKGSPLASRFLISFRDAFAHNYIGYDNEKQIINVSLSNKKRERLQGAITKNALIEIINLIKESKRVK